jgi:hypothetical protein
MRPRLPRRDRRHGPSAQRSPLVREKVAFGVAEVTEALALEFRSGGPREIMFAAVHPHPRAAPMRIVRDQLLQATREIAHNGCRVSV